MKAVHSLGRAGQREGRLSLRDRALALRDRLLADPKFQRWASAFPLTRPVARRRARSLFDLCAGFVYSQVLFACVRLRVFRILAAGPKDVTELSRLLSLSREATLRLLRAAVSLDLLSQRGPDRFGLGPHGATLLGNPGIAAMIEHHSLLYADLHDPVALLRGQRGRGGLSDYWPYARTRQPTALEADAVAPYSALMSGSQPMIADEILAAYPLDRHRCLLDLGGGDGSFLTAVAEHVPGLRLVLFDLPAVVEIARTKLAAAGLAERATAVTGNLLADSLPRGADVMTLVRIIHDHDDEAALTILRAARKALPDDGVLLVAEPMSGTSGAEPIGDAYFGFYLLAMGSGRPRTPKELMNLLKDAGFSKQRLLPTRMPLLVQVVSAEP